MEHGEGSIVHLKKGPMLVRDGEGDAVKYIGASRPERKPKGSRRPDRRARINVSMMVVQTVLPYTAPWRSRSKSL